MASALELLPFCSLADKQEDKIVGTVSDVLRCLEQRAEAMCCPNCADVGNNELSIQTDRLTDFLTASVRSKEIRFNAVGDDSNAVGRDATLVDEVVFKRICYDNDSFAVSI